MNTMPEGVLKIITALEHHGYEACAVGGCVRDTLLGREPKDWDITTSARPEQVKALFPKTIDTGILHGTVTVLLDKTGYEVTTYRIDGEYEDGRHPKNVEYTTSLLEDLKRRDFTVNAMAQGGDGRIVDAFGGMEDLKKKVIRCVGNPEDRFGEDALRILRALRFSAQLDFRIEEKTMAAAGKLAPNLAQVSKERIQTELTKLLMSGCPEKIGLIFEMGIAPWISCTFPALRPEEICLNDRIPRKKHVRWAALLGRRTREEASGILKELKLDNDTIARACILAEELKQPLTLHKPSIRRAMNRITPELFKDLLDLKTALAAGAEAEDLEKICALADEIIGDGDCLSLKDLAVRGEDLIQAGVRPGKQMGDLLNSLLGLVLEEPERNDREYLLRQLPRDSF